MTEKRYGILIASSKYPDEPGLEDLRFPENDVDAINEVLTSKDYGQFTETFVFKNAPHHEILVKINEVLSVAGKNDLVLIYFSGHGKLNRLGQLCLAAANTSLKALEATSIPVQTIKNYFDISDSRKRILILDCCYSGAAGSVFARGGVNDHLQLVSQGQGTFIMTASTGIQVAVEKEADQYGIFTKHIVEGIKLGDADKNDDGFVDMHELYEYVHEKVREEGAQEPMKWDINVKGEIMIASSGKVSREKRRQKAKKTLFEFSQQGSLPDKILSAALKIISFEKKDMTQADLLYDRLIGRLVEQKISIGDFIVNWMEVQSDQTRDESPDPGTDQVDTSEIKKESHVPETGYGKIPIEKELPEQSEEVESVQIPPKEEKPKIASAIPKESASKSKKGWGFAAVILLVLAGVFSFIIYSKKQPPEHDISTQAPQDKQTQIEKKQYNANELSEIKENSKYQLGFFSLGATDEEFQNVLKVIIEKGYRIDNRYVGSLNSRPSWLAQSSTILYYRPESKPTAQKLSRLMKEITGIEFIIQPGSGLGVEKGKESSTFFIHYIVN
jgi:hypothetical protein